MPSNLTNAKKCERIRGACAVSQIRACARAVRVVRMLRRNSREIRRSVARGCPRCYATGAFEQPPDRILDKASLLARVAHLSLRSERVA